MNDDELKVRIWDAINEYTESCGGDTSVDTMSDRRMKAVATVESELHLARTFDGAETIAAFESAVYGDGGIWPSWVYEARQAIKHQNEKIPWLPDLLKILGWQGGTVHSALNAVSRLVAAQDEEKQMESFERLKAQKDAILSWQRSKHPAVIACRLMAAALQGFTAEELKKRVSEINDKAFDEANEAIWKVVNGLEND